MVLFLFLSHSIFILVLSSNGYRHSAAKKTSFLSIFWWCRSKEASIFLNIDKCRCIFIRLDYNLLFPWSFESRLHTFHLRLMRLLAWLFPGENEETIWKLCHQLKAWPTWLPVSRRSLPPCFCQYCTSRMSSRAFTCSREWFWPHDNKVYMPESGSLADYEMTHSWSLNKKSQLSLLWEFYSGSACGRPCQIVLEDPRPSPRREFQSNHQVFYRIQLEFE